MTIIIDKNPDITEESEVYKLTDAIVEILSETDGYTSISTIVSVLIHELKYAGEEKNLIIKSINKFYE